MARQDTTTTMMATDKDKNNDGDGVTGKGIGMNPDSLWVSD